MAAARGRKRGRGSSKGRGRGRGSKNVSKVEGEEVGDIGGDGVGKEVSEVQTEGTIDTEVQVESEVAVTETIPIIPADQEVTSVTRIETDSETIPTVNFAVNNTIETEKVSETKAEGTLVGMESVESTAENKVSSQTDTEVRGTKETLLEQEAGTSFETNPLPSTTLPKHANPNDLSYPNAPSNTEESEAISELASQNWGTNKKNRNKRTKLSTQALVDQLLLTHILGHGRIDAKKVASLEFESAFEKYLWPQYDSDSNSHSHVLLLVLLTNQKIQDTNSLSPWETFATDPEKFSSFFHRVLELKLTLMDQRHPFMKKLTTQNRLGLHIALVRFLINCFQALDNTLVREQSLKLVSISTWHCLSSPQKRDKKMEEIPQLLKLWKQGEKRYGAASSTEQARMIMERTFLFNWLKQFLQLLYTIKEASSKYPTSYEQTASLYCQRALEFLIDLEAQLPSRRFFNTLVQDCHIVEVCQRAPITTRNELGPPFCKLLEMFSTYTRFEIDDFTGQPLFETEITQRLYNSIQNLQVIAFTNFRKQLEDLALDNIGHIAKPEVLSGYLSRLTDEQLLRLSEILLIRTQPISMVGNENQVHHTRDFIVTILCEMYSKHDSVIDTINKLPLYPDEESLFDDSIVVTQNYNGEYPLPLPKLNLQFLTIHDYLIRNFHLFRLEAYYEIRQDIEDAIKRLAPQLAPHQGYSGSKTLFNGWSRMATEVLQLTNVTAKKPKLGETTPSRVLADIQIHLGKYTESVQQEWKSLQRHDVVFLLAIKPTPDSHSPFTEGNDFRKHFGLTYVRGCEVIDILGDDGRPIDEPGKPKEDRGSTMKSPLRTIRIALDPNQFVMDRRCKLDVYDEINLVVRRKSKENHFKAVLETIRALMQSDLVVPDWLRAVLLGYGSPDSAHHSQLGGESDVLLFHDTFLDWHHLQQSFQLGFPHHIISTNQDVSTMVPPFQLKLTQTTPNPPPAKRPAKRPKKSKDYPTVSNQLVFSSYKKPSMGPYPSDQPHLNSIRFTPTQIKAIYSGINLGLTMVVGPPGTGKTDVAVQIISNLYHSHPDQRLLLVTHSNQALNQLFAKIIELDVDPRHLLRLGHGEEELGAEESFSKYGRVNSFLEQRITLLAQAGRLALSLDQDIAYGETCETALQFYGEFVVPRWQEFVRQSELVDSPHDIAGLFPFSKFFSDAPQPLFKGDQSQHLESAHSCYRHIALIFDQIESIRPFELLRTNRDRANYLLVKEARVVAMTCTHAALKRRELVELGFRYNNLVLEEAAQILEIETFIPLVLQKNCPDLKRVVLIGDHLQLPPVVKNLGFQTYGNMEQSLFTRLVRLGVPTVNLDAQGRARPELADLYRWRYHNLGDLDLIQTDTSFSMTNPGFLNSFQFVDVKSTETEPVPYFYQNLDEAEYVVALYQFMRLIGYPAKNISILTTYNGQVALIKDVLAARCANHPHLGLPARVSTVDKYQGEQNDYILLSLVRTKTVGHLRDIRRLTVALSRARLGLYVVGYRDIFALCPELQPSMDLFFKDGRGDKLSLIKNESYPSNRPINIQPNPQDIIMMENLAALGQLVHSMLIKIEEANHSNAMI